VQIVVERQQRERDLREKADREKADKVTPLPSLLICHASPQSAWPLMPWAASWAGRPECFVPLLPLAAQHCQVCHQGQAGSRQRDGPVHL
jgi:hypothetical protein